jgi:glycerol transport system substrate-binding protein
MTGTNVPDYPKLAQLWRQAISDASSGAKTAQAAMDSLCAEQEAVLCRACRRPGRHRTQLAEEHDLAFWNADAVAKGPLRPSSRSRTKRSRP